MAYTPIASTRYEVGKATKKDLFADMVGNEADHETRIDSIESSGAVSIDVFNEIVNLETGRVGDIRYSLLSEAQFQARFGSKWVKIDGSSLGSEDLAALYGASLPDFEDRFPRIIGGAKSVGDTEASQNKAHTHTLQKGVDVIGSTYLTPTGFATTGFITTSSDGEAEARPDSGVMSAFIKISETNLDYAGIYVAKSAFSVTQFKISNMIAGSSGSLEVDLLKGSSLGSLTSMLSSNLTLAFGTGDYATSSNASFSTSSVSQNDFVVLKVVGVQSGQDRFYANCFGSAT